MNEGHLLDLAYDGVKMTVSLTANLWLIATAAFVAVLLIIIARLLHRRGNVAKGMVPVKLTYGVGGAEIEYQIVRDFTNVEIAHRVYVELVTRKAAIQIDEEHDVIVEVYNSWYSLFQIVRDELKRISGPMLRDNPRSKDLIKLLTDLLNLGLRPHLTEYQALFRKWYSEQLERAESRGKSPQEIQRAYETYTGLMSSMKNVNRLLITHAEQLKRIVDGD